MKTFLAQQLPIKLEAAPLLKKLRIAADPHDEDFQSFSRMLDEARAIARPQYAYGIAAVEEKGTDTVLIEGRLIKSSLVRQNLDQTHRVFPYIATCGSELDRWSQAYTDLLENYWTDEIKNRALQLAIMAMRQTVKETYFVGQDLSQMSPGSLPEWPLPEQAFLFDLLQEEAAAMEVRLTDSFLMVPSKSVSGFYFTSQSHFENCRLCPMPNCPNRRVPYAEP
ncbi:MAG: vitamin B12 dependent methionine synthase [Clostridiaceae bacterium]|nr:vitamin B12 dependent methionine synthase [Clostridiaceae bacterium]